MFSSLWRDHVPRFVNGHYGRPHVRDLPHPFLPAAIRGVFLPLLLLSAGHLRADGEASFDEAWRWVSFTAESGLPSNNVLDVVETPDSTLWAMCDAGIAWYDGFQWHRVSLPSSRPLDVNVRVSDYRADSLLIGIGDEWYAAGRTGFRRLSVPPSSRLQYLAGDTIHCLSGGVSYLLTGGRMLRGVMPRESPDGVIEDVVRTRGGGVWMTTEQGLFRWEEHAWRMVFRLDRSLPGPSCLIAENEAGYIFARFELPREMRGFWVRPPGAHRPTRIAGASGDAGAIAVSPSGGLVAAQRFGDVWLHTAAGWEPSPMLRLQCRNLHRLFFRRNGDLVIAAAGGIRYFGSSSPLWQVLGAGDPTLGAVNEILVTRAGETWLGMAEGIVRYGADGTCHVVKEIHGSPLLAVTGLGEDRDGGIWVSSGGGFDGAWRWDGNRWEHVPIADGPDGARFHRIRRDRQGRLWFLGLARRYEGRNTRQPGVFLLDGNEFIPWGRVHDFPNVRVYDMAEDAAGGLWFGTQDGLFCWREGVWRRWATAEGLRHNRVFTLAADRRGRLWIGHQQPIGLGMIDSAGVVRYHTVADGLVNDAVWEVRVDSLDVPWVATRGGMASFQKGEWLRFDELSGLPSSLLWPVLPLGEYVYVGTHGSGVAVLNRREAAPPLPRVVVARPNIDGQDVDLAWKAYAFRGAVLPSEILTRYRIDDQPWSEWSKIRQLAFRNAPVGDHTLSVQARGTFGTASETAESVVFAIDPPLFFRPVVLIPLLLLAMGLLVLGILHMHKRRRYHQEIREREAKFRAVTETTSSAIFIYDRSRIHFMNPAAEALTGSRGENSGMPSMGDLVVTDDREAFAKHCIRTDGSVAEQMRSEIRIRGKSGGIRWLDFTSGPIDYAGKPMCLGTAFDITDRKNADERLRSLTSELVLTEERERRRVAVFLHDVIGQALALCKIRIRSLQKRSAAAQAEPDLGEVLGLVDESIRNTRSLTFDLCPPVLHHLAFPAALRSLVEQLLSGHDLVLEFSDGGAAVALKEEKRLVAYHVVREIVVNSIKHAHAHTVHLNVGVDDGTMTITVADDGVGFCDAAAGPAGSNGGFGLFNIRERLAGLGGALDIRSDNGRGTVAIVTIPTDEPPSTNTQGATVP